MCLFSMPAMPASPPMPPAPPTPPAPPVTPTQADPAVKAAREDARRRAAGLQGYRSTIATSGLGLQSVPNMTASALKTLLGQ
ncbi:MAG: hypothetical protein Q8M19_01965 [Reyranella sp.]|nr:hypothetical protein [Reyranella sp.]